MARGTVGAGPPGDPKAHIFLVGFPRSGTTLLENVLAAHPEVVTLEEKDCLASVAAPYVASADGLERLARIDPAEATRQREAYWSCVEKFGIEPRGRVFIDKMPLSSGLLPIVAKLFPNARVLFARRDPRDVVLSCFRRRFGMNASMYQLLTLDGAAAYYDAVMSLSEIYSGLLPLLRHVVRYESMVSEFEGTVSDAATSLAWNGTRRCSTSQPRHERAASRPQARPRWRAGSTAKAKAPGAATANKWRQSCRCLTRGSGALNMKRTKRQRSLLPPIILRQATRFCAHAD